MKMKTKMKQLLKSRFLGIVLLFTAVGLIAGCSQTEDSDFETEPGNGYVVIKLTDAPFPADLVAEANVTIDWIQMLKYDGDDYGEGQEMHDSDSIVHVMFELDEAVTFNLLELNNGITTILGEKEVPAGNYDEIRLHVVDAGIVLKDSTKYDLKVPSGNSSGLKIKMDPYLNLEDGEYAEVLLDFDVSRSFVVRGNINKGKVNGFIFKPVVRAVANVQTDAGEVNGIVSDTTGTLLDDALLTLISGEDTIVSAITDTSGFYAMIGIAPGDYTLFCDKDSFEIAEKDISVEAGMVTVQDFDLVPAADSTGN
jgi:hypothetical protein